MVVLDSVPPPLTVQVTPALFWSLVTVADKVVESVPSTVLAAAVTATLTGGALPPHPVMLITAKKVVTKKLKRTLIRRAHQDRF